MPAAKRSTKSTTRAKKTKRASVKTTTRSTASKTTRSATAKKSTRTTARASATSKTARRSTTASARAATTSSAKKRAPSAAFMAPVQPDSALSAIVGNKPLPRTQVTKKLWNYIKKHDLQDATKRTMINADANLRPVFGGKRKVDMFQMTKLVSQHVAKIK